MPQIIVDTATESPQSLSMLARLLQDYAVLKAKTEAQAAQEYPSEPPATGFTADGRIIRAGEPLPPAVSMPTVAAAPVDEQDPAKLFAKPSNILPFPQPPVATAPAVTPAALPAAAPVADTSTKTLDQTSTAQASAAEVPQGTKPLLEIDGAGVPWDARIHSSAKGKKQDGTWKLARNVDKALVTMVLQEITPKPHIVDGVVIPVGAALPVASPVTVPGSPVPVPPAPVNVDAAAPVPAFVPAAGPAVPVPPVPAAGAVPAAPLNPVQQFQQFMKLVAEGQASVPPKFSHADVVAACVAEGLPQLQLVIMRPDLIPAIKTRLGLV